MTAEPTPIIGLIHASEGGGAFIREKPGGIVLATLANGATVTIVPNDLQDINKVIWVHVFATVNDKRIEGWMIQSVLQTATPVANWQPSSTPAVTSNSIISLLHKGNIMPIHFGTDGWRAVISDTFTFDNLRIVAQAIADAVASEYWDTSPAKRETTRTPKRS